MSRRKKGKRGAGHQRPVWRTGLWVALAFPALGGTPALADSGDDAEPFELGVITVVGKRVHGADTNDQVSSVVGHKVMREFNRENVGDALNLLSGVSATVNSRNEKTISVRGFDSRQVPLFIDGIPVYVPYDGYVDFNRFTTADLAAIQVAKGFSSVTYGANTLGGAINLVSRKPVREFEGDAMLGVGPERGRRATANLGTNQGLWYAQAGYSLNRDDGFPMSSNFTPTPTEDGGVRNNAYHKDEKFSLKLGLTPGGGDEYALSYYKQNGEKGQPPSTDPAYARYWRWPYWDKESLYFVSRTGLGEFEAVKLRFYRDRYDNQVDTYTDSTYSTLKTSGSGSVGTGRSIYHDRTNGGSVELESTRLANNTLRLAFHYKTDEHEERDATGQQNTHYEDTLISFAAENEWRILPQLALSLGLAHHELRPDTVFSRGNPYSLPEDQGATDAQAGLFYDLSNSARLYATIARKSRLPTLKDRYSQRLGTYIENPNLKPEESLNYEIGYRGSPWAGGKLQAAVFYSDISDKIQSVANIVGTRSQMQNVGKVRNTGIELDASHDFGGWLEVGGNYSWINVENRSNPETRITDVPRNKLTARAVLRPINRAEVIAFVEYDSSRWASNTVRLSGFTTLNLKASYEALKGLSIEAGANNVTDRNYSLSDGYPAPGRMWFANVIYQF